MTIPPSLSREISPPPRARKRWKPSEPLATANHVAPPIPAEPTLAAVEAGRAKLEDHLTYFRKHLATAWRETPEDQPRISLDDWAKLYVENQHEHGNHFVVHQHNHPVSGVHYDLRLQFSATSSISFALPKGLPGNPNSRSLGRLAVETRVHNLWNHLIETASSRTGSLLIWDTGTYSILPRKSANKHPPSPQTTDDEGSDTEPDNGAPYANGVTGQHENERLVKAFQTHYIRLRLHGARLPKNYTVTLRLPSANSFNKQPRSSRLRRKNGRDYNKAAQQHLSTDSELEEELHARPQQGEEEVEEIDTDEEEDAQTRLDNAYPGSTNSIGSVHQRQWFMLLDRTSSGLVQGQVSGQWVCREEREGFQPFFVRGRDYERSIVTGRLAKEVESDEGVEGFKGRSGWMGIMH
ncbi:hypothetical protein CC80DRAFT_524077 [Byssothecium circinans]|uniref:DNA ligase D 3'-phosphoesterase domain-containing protein n=1 Tax=Byssothecium circinans TaxID=147558 RepID=A0A6A5UBS4_9PLEO|nr:hypothetical protein CC80DRAFT_524077 [Byssothecium circinans]